MSFLPLVGVSNLPGSKSSCLDTAFMGRHTLGHLQSSLDISSTIVLIGFPNFKEAIFHFVLSLQTVTVNSYLLGSLSCYP